MGFEVNPPSNKPIIREAASMQNDGGAGNLGYFENEGKRKEKDQQESIFSHGLEADTFGKEGEEKFEKEDFSISKLIANVIFSVKEWFKGLLK